MESTSRRLVQPGTSASSTKLAGRACEKNVIWSLLMDDKVSIIGIYGMGGIGKTTMLRNICTELLERQDISHSIYWVNVPQDFRIDRSQDLIAKRLDLNLSSIDDDLCGVVELAKELKMKQKWILILNDLWNSFDPQELEIPIPLNGSKFIMTTRSKMVCQQMKCQNSIKVDRLSDEDALTLFMEKLGHDRQLSQEEKGIAEDAARECGGLPLGIVTLAESLKGVHELHKWKITLKRLKESNFWDMEDQIFQILRLSYDCLDEPAKQCFVYCAQFHESLKIEREELIKNHESLKIEREELIKNHESLKIEREELIKNHESLKIEREELIKKFIEEGIIKESDEGHSILDMLENVCLLERIDDGKAVKMHVLLRDMAKQLLDDEYSLDMGQGRKRIEMAPLKSGWTLLLTNLILEIKSAVDYFKSRWTLLMANLILEMASAVFDQLGNALVGMVLAFVALLLSTAELIYMERMSTIVEYFRWVGAAVRQCFYARQKKDNAISILPISDDRRSSTTTLTPGKPVGTIVEYFGWVGAVWQLFYSTVEYAYTRQKKDNPIKMTLLPFIFLLCVVISKLIKKSHID